MYFFASERVCTSVGISFCFCKQINFCNSLLQNVAWLLLFLHEVFVAEAGKKSRRWRPGSCLYPDACGDGFGGGF
jgi:hypothetical protein